jgi:hypothetical protein
MAKDDALTQHARKLIAEHAEDSAVLDELRRISEETGRPFESLRKRLVDHAHDPTVPLHIE